jgi:phospholipid/cholesterol/gamma-HCH transport system permease protein
MSAARALRDAEAGLQGCHRVEVDLSAIERIDGAGAVVLGRFLDRIEARGIATSLVTGRHAEAARLVALYRRRHPEPAASDRRGTSRLARLGSLGLQAPTMVANVLDFTGQATIAVPGAVTSPGSVDWRSLPRLVRTIGADGLPVTAAANLLIGLIIGFLGVSQLRRFGATAYVPQLVTIAQLRELGPLVTAIVVAGRSGAGLSSELATMKVTEEIDALRSMGFDPIRWLVVPRCLALLISVPLLTWIGHFLSLSGGLIATTALTNMSPRAYALATADAITSNDFITGLTKSPFLSLAIGLIACGQGLTTYGGAAAVGARTTSAVVLSIFGVIAISALFTALFIFMGV